MAGHIIILIGIILLQVYALWINEKYLGLFTNLTEALMQLLHYDSNDSYQKRKLYISIIAVSSLLSISITIFLYTYYIIK